MAKQCNASVTCESRRLAKIMGYDGVQTNRFQIKIFPRLFLTLSNILSFKHSFIIAPGILVSLSYLFKDTGQILTAADDNFCDIFSIFSKKLRYDIS